MGSEQHMIIVDARVFAWSYPGERGQVRQVRAAIFPLLDGCPLADDAVLIASELAANAAVHSGSAAPGGRFTVRAEVRRGDYVRIEVEDQGGPWTRRGTADDRPHGLDLVAALAGPGNWGVDGGPEHGRVVWARLDWPKALPVGTAGFEDRAQQVAEISRETFHRPLTVVLKDEGVGTTDTQLQIDRPELR